MKGANWHAVAQWEDLPEGLTPVEVGHSNGRETEIISGIAAGDSIVIHASDKVSDGVRITPRRGQ